MQCNSSSILRNDRRIMVKSDDKTLSFRRRKNNVCQYHHALFLLVLALEPTLREKARLRLHGFLRQSVGTPFFQLVRHGSARFTTFSWLPSTRAARFSSRRLHCPH